MTKTEQVPILRYVCEYIYRERSSCSSYFWYMIELMAYNRAQHMVPHHFTGMRLSCAVLLGVFLSLCTHSKI